MRATVVDSVCPLNDREVVDRIIEFSEHINQRTLYAYQVLFSRRIVETVLKQDGQTVTGLFSRQSGKCFAKGTPIMMADGLLKSVEDVVVGDRVMGDDGTPRNVLNLSRGRSLMYRVSAKTNYHDSYVCNAQHLVTVYNERTGAVEDVQAKKLYLSSEHSTHPDGDSVVRHLKGMQGSVQFKAQPVPIDPYWLGLWIGDGTSRSTAITNIDQEVIDYIYEYAEELGMQICNKHIPSIYRFNDEETRRLLLAGLIDSDGSKSNKNSSNTTSACEITFKQKVLAEHTQWLMRSLRLRASLSEKVVNGVSYWRVVGFGDFREIPTRVPRKQWRDDEVPMRDHMRFGMRIKSLGVDNFYGFETDGNHRFLLGDFTVTHNSETLACISLALVLILPALAQEFPDDKRFKSFVHGVAIGVFAPSKHHSGIIYSRMRSRVESSFFDELLADPTIDTKIAHSRGDSFAFENGSRVEAHTASENVLNEGGTFHLVLVDESQKLSTQKIDKELRPMLASTNGSMVMIGTAFMGGGAFYKQINTNLGGERATGIKNHFQFPYDVVIKHRRALFNKDQNPAHLNYEKWVAAELARLGGNIDNSSFKMNFRLLWGSSSSFAVPMVLFKSLGRVDLEANRPWFGQGRVVAGIDFAKSNDHTWITVGYVDTVAPIIQNAKFGREQSMTTYSNRTILGWKMLQGLFEGEGGQYAQIISFLSYWPQLQCVVADGTGMGDPICERLQSLLPGITVIPYVFTTPSKHFMYTTYLQEVEARRISYPAGPATVQTPEYQAFISQHEGLAKTHVGQYIKCEAASEDEHEDACDSACLFVIAGETVTVPDVNPSARRGSSNTVPMVDLGSNRPLIIGGNSNGRYSTRW